jgi:hypothetical protein
MSTLRSASHTFDIPAEPNHRPVLRRLSDAAQAYWSAAVEGLDAARTYDEETRRGATHEQAMKKVFDRHWRTR